MTPDLTPPVSQAALVKVRDVIADGDLAEVVPIALKLADNLEEAELSINGLVDHIEYLTKKREALQRAVVSLEEMVRHTRFISDDHTT